MPARRVALALALASLLPVETAAAATPQRTRFELPFSSGRGAGLVDLKQRRLTQFREHLFAAEEPQLDEGGEEIWDGSQFAAVYTRDLLYDAFFGLRVAGDAFWLVDVPVDEQASGYAGVTEGDVGGAGIVKMVQKAGAIEATTFAFSPRDLPGAGVVLALRVRNTSAQPVSDVEAFSLHNFHLGYGRPQSPWDVGQDLAANGETITLAGGDIVERGFAGVIALRPLAPVSHRGFGPEVDVYATVAAGEDLPDNAPLPDASQDALAALQFSLGALAPGEERWVGVAFAHHGDPFAGEAVRGWLDDHVAGSAADAVAGEVSSWALYQAALELPSGLDEDDEALVRHAAAMLRMGQVQEDSYYLRAQRSDDGDVRRTRFPLQEGGDPAALPATIVHHARGSILASMPPGNWTYAWIRDGAYATVALSTLGVTEAAADSLRFYLGAEAGRFVDWQELAGYDLPPYQITLVRYYGFGVEETDFNEFGPNLEFDGFGLFLWALRAHERLTGDTSVADEHWALIQSQVADVIVALVEPETGLLRPDSSIWETHWEGRERHFAYTNITAARGLCDVADIAERRGDAAQAALYREAGEALRDAIALHLTDADGAIAASREELAAGEGYWDAAVLDAIAMGLFDPTGTIAQATLAGLDAQLAVAAGPGWSRNDDRWDHPNAADLSPWGSDYDSAEWVITDLRGAIARRLAGDEAGADALTDWVRDQALVNYLMVAETFEENDGTYKFNAPMLGFGAGAFILAMAQRADGAVAPACGAYYDEGPGPGTDSDTETTGESDASTTGESDGTEGTASSSDATTDASTSTTSTFTTAGGDETESALTFGEADDSGCACATGSRTRSPWLAALLVFGLAGRRRSRVRRTRG